MTAVAVVRRQRTVPGRDRPRPARKRAAPRAAVHQSRAVLARLRGPGAVRGARPPQPAARPGQLPDDLREHARRVLPDPDRPACASSSTPGRRRRRPTAGPPASSSSRPASASWSSSPTSAPPGPRSASRSPARASRSSGTAAIPEHHASLRQRFIDEIYPVLTPLAVDPGHPFPYISTLSLSIAVGLRDPETGRAPLRPGQGPPDPAAALPGRAEPLRAPRPDHRGQPRPAVQRHGDRRAPPVPGHPQRRPRDRGGRGGRPAAGDRGGAPAAALRRGRPPRGRAVDAGDDAGDPAPRARPRRGRRVRGPGHARPDRPARPRRPRPAGPEERAVDAGHAAAPRPARRGRAGRRLRRDPRSATSSSTTRTRTSRPRSSGSSARPSTIPRSSRSR